MRVRVLPFLRLAVTMVIPSMSRSDMSYSDMGRSILKPRWIFGFVVVLVTLITLFTHTASQSVSGLVNSISTTVSKVHLHCSCCLLTTTPETLSLDILHAVKQQWQGRSSLPHPSDKQQPRLLQAAPLLNHPRLPHPGLDQLGRTRRSQPLQATSCQSRDTTRLHEEAEAYQQGR